MYTVMRVIPCVRPAEPHNHPARVKLKRLHGHCYITGSISSEDKSQCVHGVVNWIKAANFTLDIAFFFIFHKKIIRALIRQAERGLRIRLIVYRCYAGDKPKNHKYISDLKKKGIQILWCDNITTFKGDKINRLLLMDGSDPENRPAICHNDAGMILGLQPDVLLESRQVILDVKEVLARKVDHSSITLSRSRKYFEDLWNEDETSSVF